MTRTGLRRLLVIVAMAHLALAHLGAVPAQSDPPSLTEGLASSEVGPGDPNFDPVKVSASLAKSQATSGETVEVTVTAKMLPNWHINSNTPLEEWLIPTEVFFDSTGTFTVTKVVYPQAKRLKFEFSEEPMAVYEGSAPVKAQLRLGDNLPAGDLEIRGLLSYQACDDKSCLAPTEKPFRVILNVATAGGGTGGGTGAASAPATSEDPPAGSEAASGAVSPPAGETAATDASADNLAAGEAGVKSRLTSSLARHFGNPLIALLLTLLAGLLSAATPCVYPMIPITARILMGRGGDNPALGRLHAFMYFLGIILVYAILGIIAGITGGGFNEIMRIPQVILGFAILFAFLGLSMLGFFEIQIPQSIASRVDSSTSQRSGLVGTMLMGAGAGLVVSPCVGPVVIFILTQIAAQMAEIEAAGGGAFSSTAKVVYGGFLMAGYGAGLGVPFLLVGIFSAKLAQPGGWMTTVRVVLGLVILYFAYDYFHKAMATAGVERGVANAILSGVVLIFLAILWGAFRTKIEDGPHAGWHKIRLASTVIMLVTGIFFLWTGLNRSGIVPGTSTGAVTVATGAAQTGEAVETTGALTWHRDYERAQELAKQESLPIFVDFYAHWCANCKVFSHQAAQPGPLQAALGTVILAKVYDTDAVFEEFKSDPRYPELKRGLPFFLILSSEGEFLWKGADYRAHDTMIREIEKARARERTGA